MTLNGITTLLSSVGSLASILLASAAFIISYRTFKRQQTFDNENHFHRYKFDKYVSILKMIINYLNLVDNIVFDTYDKFKRNDIKVEDMKAFADEIDDLSDKLQDKLACNVGFIPTEIVKQIDRIIDLIYDNAIGEETSGEEYESTQKVLKEIVDEVDNLQELMIKDLGLDNISKHLARRTRGDKNR